MIAENQSSVDRKNRRDADLATNIRETRSVTQYVLDQTNFYLYRSEFTSTITRIRNMRLLYHLGRYTPRALKEKQVAQFREYFQKVSNCLESMMSYSEAYKLLVMTQPTNHSLSNTNISVKHQREEENQFRYRTIKNIKEVYTLWVEVFEYGSLKRLIQVLLMLRMEDYDMTMHYNIEEWARTVYANLTVMQRKKQKGIGCCL